MLLPYVGVLNGKADMRVEHFSPETKHEIMKYALHYYNPELNIKTKSSANRTFPPMTIAFVLIGSLGDVQPFVPVAKRLQVSQVNPSLFHFASRDYFLAFPVFFHPVHHVMSRHLMT